MEKSLMHILYDQMLSVLKIEELTTLAL
jgi:hypothetical protein